MFLVPGGSRVFPVRSGTVCLAELFGAIRPLEFMSLAGNSKSGNSHKQDGE